MYLFMFWDQVLFLYAELLINQSFLLCQLTIVSLQLFISAIQLYGVLFAHLQLSRNTLADFFYLSDQFHFIRLPLP